MSEFFAKEFYGNTILSWTIALLIILGSILLGKILYWFFTKIMRRLTSKTKTRLDDIIVDMIEEPIVVVVTVFGFGYAINSLSFTPEIEQWLKHAFNAAITLTVTWLVARLLESLIEEYLVPLAEQSESDLDDQLLPIAKSGLRTIIWCIGIIVALNNAGFDVGALIAGLGIGGLALAMAAKDFVANIFGGFTIFSDKPFMINERIQINGFDGTVTEIGIRSTRLKTLAGREVSIPNSKFMESIVENISREPSRKITLNLGMTYDTTGPQLEQAMQLLKDIAAKHQSLEENVLVGFNNFGDFALGILFVYYIKKGEDILATQTEINLEILKQFNANGLEFAFPSQTIYQKQVD